MTVTISPRRLALALIAAVAITAGVALGEHALQCATGFKVSSTTGQRLTCQRSLTVEDQKRAEKLSRKWLSAAACNGHMVDPQASIAEADVGFLVTVRFTCEGE